jgi:hypothetical protein
VKIRILGNTDFEFQKKSTEWEELLIPANYRVGLPENG